MIRITSLVLCLILAGLALAQEAPSELTARQRAAKRAFYGGQMDAETHEKMQGVWRVMRMDWDGGTWTGQDLQGMLLIDEGHFSFEVYAYVPTNTSDEVMFQTGIYRYSFNSIGEMEAAALIGLSNAQNLGDPEPVGPLTYNFKVLLAGDNLTLERPGSRLTMRRIPQPKPPFHDRIERMKAGEDQDLESGGDR